MRTRVLNEFSDEQEVQRTCQVGFGQVALLSVLVVRRFMNTLVMYLLRLISIFIVPCISWLILVYITNFIEITYVLVVKSLSISAPKGDE